MTLSASKCSRYSIGERLSIGTVAVMRGPLRPLDSESKRVDAACAPCASADTKQSSTASASSPHRSIFSAYWKTDRHLSRPLCEASQSCGELKAPKQSRRRIHKTFSYTYDRDPYEFFGIEEDGSKTSSTFCDDDSDSLNLYELNLRNQEAEVGGETRRKIRTCPSLLRTGAAIDGMARGEKTTKSDTVLFAKTSSCLRKSRFCFDGDNSNNDGIQPRKGDTMGKIPRSVSFESRIMVRLFEPPIEKWAPIGWSNWFGPWH